MERHYDTFNDDDDFTGCCRMALISFLSMLLLS